MRAFARSSLRSLGHAAAAHGCEGRAASFGYGTGRMHWLFLRGLAREARHWGAFPRVFEGIVPDATVHLLDLPGAGTEHERRSPDTAQGIAEDVRRRFLEVRTSTPGEPWSLLGMSLGGMVAMAWVDAHPGDFERVVLVSTSASDLSPPWRRFGPSALRGAVRAFATRDPVAREKHIVGISTRLVRDTDTVARAWASYAHDAPMRRSNVARQVRAGMRFRAPGRLGVPALVLAGAGDRLSDASCGRRLAAHLGTELVVHPQGGHELALDAPQWLAGEVARWTASAVSGPR